MPESSSSNVSAAPSFKRDSSPGSDRRVWVRYPSRRTVSCQPASGDEGPSWRAQACDVSLGGIKLLSAQKFERGTSLKIKIEGDGTEQSILLTAQVRYAIPMPEGNWIMGCAFESELSEKDLLAWLGPQG